MNEAWKAGGKVTADKAIEFICECGAKAVVPVSGEKFVAHGLPMCEVFETTEVTEYLRRQRIRLVGGAS